MHLAWTWMTEKYFAADENKTLLQINPLSIRHPSSWIQSFSSRRVIRKTSWVLRNTKNKRWYLCLRGSKSKGQIQGPERLYRSSSATLVGFSVINVETFPFCFSFNCHEGIQHHDIIEKAEVLLSAGCLCPVACSPAALGRKAFEAGYNDVFQRDYLSFRPDSDLIGSSACPIHQTYPVIIAMVYGI